jgi:hypothetical protein
MSERAIFLEGCEKVAEGKLKEFIHHPRQGCGIVDNP